MSLNPTLKNTLVRIAYVVGSLALYLFLFNRPFLFWTECDFNHYTLTGSWQFAVALAIIWANTRKLAKSIRLLTIGSYLLVFTGLMFWYKVEALPVLFNFIPNDCGFFTQQSNYRLLRILCCIGFILLASILPIFFKSTDARKYTKLGKIWIWITILLLDFAAAMPNIYYCEQMADRLYTGARKIGKNYTRVYAIGMNDYPVFSVLLPQDSIRTTPQHYLKVNYERHGDLLICPETQDTIWIEKGGARQNPNRQTIENNTSCLMRWQWQYHAWHKIKRLFCKEENE